MKTTIYNILDNYNLTSKHSDKIVILISNFIDNNKHQLTLELLADNIQFAFINYTHTCYDIITCTNIAKEILKIMEG